MRHPALENRPFTPMTAEQVAAFRPLVTAALAEDSVGADVTTRLLIPFEATAAADVVFRSGGVVAGLPLVASAFALMDSHLVVEGRVADGSSVPARTTIARVLGSSRAILSGERVALNLLGRLSGIATLTRSFVDAVAGLPVRICDTRKTTPGLRALERYAVRAGGGYNHRFNLADAVLIKDNHLCAAGSAGQAVAAVRAHAPASFIVECECETLEQVRAAVDAGVDAVLLDNMDLTTLRSAVEIARGHAISEASGGITLANVRGVAQTGVDVISVGALTHSAPSADVALDFSVPTDP